MSSSQSRSFSITSRSGTSAYSWLAVFESLVAGCVLIGFSYWLGTWWYAAIATLLSPLKLMRTRESDKLSIWLSAKVFGFVYFFGNDEELAAKQVTELKSEQKGKIHREHIECSHWAMHVTLFTLLFTLFLTLTPIFWLVGTLQSFAFFFALLGAKLIALLFTIVRRPCRSLRAIPRNWRNVVFRTDCFKPIELLPGMHRITKGTDFDSVLVPTRLFLHAPFASRKGLPTGFWGSEFLQAISNVFNLFESWLGVLVLFGPAYLSRLASKATAILVGPLMYLTLKEIRKKPLEHRIAVTTNSKASKAMRAWSIVMIFLFVSKCAIYASYSRIGDWWNEHFEFINWVVVPYRIEVWQIAGLIQNLLPWILYLHADRVRLDQEFGLEDKKTADNIFKSLAILRWALTVYTSSVLVYLLLFESNILKIEIGNVFPW